MFTPTPTPKLTEALAKAKLEFKPINRGEFVSFPTKRGTISFQYATLEDIIGSVTEPLSRNGLALVSQIIPFEQSLYLVSRITHSSGESIESYYPLPQPSASDPKPFGAALKYGRRYNTLCLLEVGTIDHEGDTPEEARQKGYDRYDNLYKDLDKPDLYPEHNGQIKNLRNQLGFDSDYILDKTNGLKPSQLTLEQYHDLLKAIATDYVLSLDPSPFETSEEIRRSLQENVDSMIAGGSTGIAAIASWLNRVAAMNKVTQNYDTKLLTLS